MKVTLTHDGKSVELDLTAEQMAALGLKEEKKKTGYERVGKGEHYFLVNFYNGVIRDCGGTFFNGESADALYDAANYYSHPDIAKANARADKLMRQLRRFAAENGGIPNAKELNDSNVLRYSIRYDYNSKVFNVFTSMYMKHFGDIFFKDRNDAMMAIDKFHDELIWYFTEYDAMLR